MEPRLAMLVLFYLLNYCSGLNQSISATSQVVTFLHTSEPFWGHKLGPIKKENMLTTENTKKEEFMYQEQFHDYYHPNWIQKAKMKNTESS